MSSPIDAPQGFYGWTDTLKGVYYGPGSTTTALPKLLSVLGVKKALIVTGKSLYTKTDVVTKVESILKDHGAFGATFYDIGEHAPIAGIRRGIDIFKQNECDVIVSIGGGSPIDASKAILYHIQQETGGPMLRQIAIPTTLSAAEYTIVAGFTSEEGNKTAILSQELAPAGIILDAELTLDTPDRLWLSSGIRALDHAVESLYRPLIPAPLKVLSYAAIADLFTYLPQSKADPQAIGVRQKLQLASWMSLWPIKMDKFSGFGLSHALGGQLGAKYHIPHGITSCLTLAPTVALKAQIASHEDKEQLAQVLFYLRQPSTGSLEGDISRLASLIGGLVRDLDLWTDLARYEVPVNDLHSIAERALGSPDDPNHEKVVNMLKGLYPRE